MEEEWGGGGGEEQGPMLQKGGRHIDPCNVFVKHLPGDMDDAGLVELFCTHGTVVSAKVMVDPQTNASLGFGSVAVGRVCCCCCFLNNHFKEG